MNLFFVMIGTGLLAVLGAAGIILTEWTPGRSSAALSLFVVGALLILAAIPVGVLAA